MDLQKRFDNGEKIEFEVLTIVLASGSPRRSAILDEAGIPFVKIVGGFDESELEAAYDHNNVSLKQAKKYAKVVAAAKLIPFQQRIKNGAVITCDTTVWCDGKIIEKPITKERCEEQHRFLMGKNNYAITGYAVYYKGLVIVDVMCSTVKIVNMSDGVIEAICSEEETLDSSGYRNEGAIEPYLFVSDKERANMMGICPAMVKKLLKKIKF